MVSVKVAKHKKLNQHSLIAHNASLSTDSDSNFDQTFGYFTHSALEDKTLFSFLSSEKNGRRYYAQAELNLRRINVFNPPPVFNLYSSDIPESLAKEIKSLGDEISDKLITNVVRRIYEAVDSEYYHTNGIYGKVRYHIHQDGVKTK